MATQAFPELIKTLIERTFDEQRLDLALNRCSNSARRLFFLFAPINQIRNEVVAGRFGCGGVASAAGDLNKLSLNIRDEDRKLLRRRMQIDDLLLGENRRKRFRQCSIDLANDQLAFAFGYLVANDAIVG